MKTDIKPIESNRVLTDFRVFLYLVWQHLGLPAPSALQYDIAQFIGNCGPEKLNLRRMVQAFRGVGKSWIVAAFVCWRLLKNPDEKVLIVSASKPLADEASIFIKRLIAEMPILQHLSPREGQRDANIAFDVGPAKPAKAPSVKSVGITGQMTGSRASLIVPDDIETLNNSMTQDQRDKLGNTIKEFDAILVPGGEIVYLGTPQSESSIYRELPERGYTVRIWPSEVPEAPEKYGQYLAPYIQGLVNKGIPSGNSTYPERFSNYDLNERKLSYGKSGYALQFMLDTSESDAERHPLSISDLMVLDFDATQGKAPVKLVWAGDTDHVIDDLQSVGLAKARYHKPMFVSEEWSDFTGSVMAIDPSGKGKDQTAYCVIKMLFGNLYVVAAGGFTDGYSPETLTALAHVAKKHQVNYVITERNFGDGMFDQLLKPYLARIHPCTIDPDGVRNSVQKERRIIDTLEPVMNQHRLIFLRSVIEQDLKVKDPKHSLIYQLSRITFDRGSLASDDMVDVLAIGVAYWIQALAANQDSALDRYKADYQERAMENFMETLKIGSGKSIEVLVETSYGNGLQSEPYDTLGSMTWA